jgi:hypothetical protein
MGNPRLMGLMSRPGIMAKMQQGVNDEWFKIESYT